MYSPRGEQKGGLRPGTVWGGVAARSSPWCAKRQTHASIEGGREGEDLGVCWVPGIVVWVRRGAEIPTPFTQSSRLVYVPSARRIDTCVLY